MEAQESGQMDFYNFFSFSAKKAIFRASEITVQFNNQYLEPEHIFFSILNLRSCSAMQVLHQMGVNIPKLNYSLEAYLYEHAGSFKGTASFSARTLTLLDNSYKEVKRLHHREIGTTHILISLPEQSDPFLRLVFDQHNLTSKKIRDTYMTHLKGYSAETDEDTAAAEFIAQQTTGVRSSPTKANPYCTEVTEVTRLATFLAKRLKHREIGLGHILYAFSTIEGALQNIESTWQTGPLKPSLVLVRIATELDRFHPESTSVAPALGEGVTNVIAEAFKRTLGRKRLASVEFDEFSEVLLEQAADYYKPILAKCTYESEADPEPPKPDED